MIPYSYVTNVYRRPFNYAVHNPAQITKLISIRAVRIVDETEQISEAVLAIIVQKREANETENISETVVAVVTGATQKAGGGARLGRVEANRNPGKATTESRVPGRGNIFI